MAKFRPHTLVASLVLGVSLCGCGGGSAPAGVSTNVQAAFKTTVPYVREFAEEAVIAESKGEYGVAFVRYRALSLNPELTPEQRNAADAAMLEMSKKLREAAENGNTEAAQVLQNYRATR
jgi:hypothetical protein